YSDGFSHSFKELGQDAYEIIADFEILQKQWARENDFRYSTENWMFEILMAQIKAIKPDIIYLQGTEWSIPGLFFHERPNDNLIKILKDEYSFIKKLIVFSGYPCGADRIKGVDILFACSPSLMRLYQKMGFDPILLYHSFDKSIINKLNGQDKQYGFTFAGSTRAPESRYWALRQLMDETDLQAWIYEYSFGNGPQTLKQKIRSTLKRGFSVFSDRQVNGFDELKIIPRKFRDIFLDISRERMAFKGVKKNKGDVIHLSELYPDRCFAPVAGMDMYNLLHESRITFNKRADPALGYVGNMRMFEATGVGTCLLTDTGQNMPDLFEEDKEVVTYSSIDEAVEKVNYLLNHPDESKEIARAGQIRTLKDHTIMKRCQQIDEVIQKLL
ncbi:MAG: glycosyltransferase, partial [Desulfobacterales bacterium]|nr:glycosyltransferase [Desulfobacterales bacterium]